MKKNLVILILGAVLVGLLALGAVGDNTYQTFTAKSAKTYANSQLDTTATLTIGAWTHVALRIYYKDSISCVFKTDYRVYGNTAWSAVSAASADTVVDTGTAGYVQIVLRDNTTERVPGVSTQFRIRPCFAAAGNSANSSATYNLWVEYGK